jgi:hypothetical protein
MSNDVEKAAQIIGELEQKRSACVQRGTELADERANVALAAHTGDAKAAKRLDEIHKAIVVHGSELASLDAALKAAGERLTAAKEAEAREQEHQRELEWRKEAEALREVFEDLDDNLADVAELANTAREKFHLLRQLGFAPTDQQWRALGARALKTALMSTLWMDVDLGPVPPSERRSFLQLYQVWLESKLPPRPIQQTTRTPEAA